MVLPELFKGPFAKNPRTVALIQKVARGELGHDGELDDETAGVRAQACLRLAEQHATDIKPVIEGLLPKTSRKPDVLALETALMLLGDPKHLRPEHFCSDFFYRDEAMQLIESCNGREGMDLLVKAGLDSPDAIVQEESLLLFQKITGRRWHDETRAKELSRSIKAAKQWWREHGTEFMARRRAEK